MSSRKTAGRKAGYVRRRAGSTREKGRRALSLILAVFMVMASSLDAIPAKAADTLTDSQGVTYEVLDATAKTLKVTGLSATHSTSITFANGKSGRVVINNQEYTVTEVADNAFCGSNVANVSFPETITKFGNGILDKCTNLSYVYNGSKNVAFPLPDLGMVTDAWWDSDARKCVTEIGGSTGCISANKTANKAYVITFNANGGQYPDETTSFQKRVLTGFKLEKPTDEPTKEGYIFLGWEVNNSSTTASEEFFNKNIEAYTTAYHILTLYAVWQKIPEADVQLTDPYSNDKEMIPAGATKYFVFRPTVSGTYTFTVNWSATVMGNKDQEVTLHQDSGVGTVLVEKGIRTDTEYDLQAGVEYWYEVHNTITANQRQIAVKFQSKGSTGSSSKSISNCVITLGNQPYVYTGSQITPAVTVKDNGTTLTQGTHYTCEYHNNIEPGTAYVRITGMGDYSGSVDKEYTIGKAKAPNAPSAITVDYSTTKVKDVSLNSYTGWKWLSSDESKELIVGETEATAVYFNDTTGKYYENSPAVVTITRQPQATVSLTKITLSQTTLSMKKGEVITLTASPNEGASLGTVTWTSSNDNVTVSGSGDKATVTAVKKGTATITAQSGSVSAKCEVTVMDSVLSTVGDFTFSTLEYGYGTPSDKTVTLKNNGDAAASEMKAFLSDGTNFRISASPASTLEANSQTTVSVVPKLKLNVGTYSDTLVISYKGGTDIKIPVSCTVDKQTITVKADDREIMYGEDLPTDFQYQITPQGIADLEISCTVNNVTGKPEIGTYPIEVSVTSQNSNYKIVTQNGTLTVKKKTVSDDEITFPMASNVTAGQQLSESTLSGGSTQYGTFTWENGTEILNVTGNNKKNVVLTLSDAAQKNHSFEGVTGYNSDKGTITRAVDIYVGRADMPSIEFPSGLMATYGMHLKDISLTEWQSENGEFTWKTPETELNQIGERQYVMVFEWSEEVKNQYQLNSNELKMEKEIVVTVEKADNTEIPEKPVLLSRTASAISVQGQEGVQYSLDKSKWTTVGSGEFQNLSPFTKYTIYARYAATETHKESQPVEALTVYTLVDNPYEIDLSKIGDANYRDALYSEYTENKKQSTISYDDSSKELTLLDSVDVYGDGYILKGKAEDVTVKTGNSGQYNITLENGMMKKLELSGGDTDLKLPGNSTSTVTEGINAQNNLTVSGPGKLAAREIEVSNGNLNLRNLTAEVGTSATGKAALSAKEVAITDSSNVTATGGEGAPAISSNGKVAINDSAVTANAGKGASSIVGDTITMKNAEVTVETDGSDVPAIKATGDIELEGDTKVNSNTAKEDNLYSKPPVGESEKPGDEEEKEKYSVTYEYKDGQKINEQKEENAIISLPTIEAEQGYQMAWKEKNTGKTYKPGDKVTVDSDLYFIQEATPILVARITLDSTVETIEVGDGVNLAETVEPQDALDPSVTWSSSNSQVATVNQEGNVTGIAPGTATITVTANDAGKASASCIVTVLAGEPEEIEVERVTVSGDTKKVAPGKKVKLTAAVYPDNATDKSVSWEVSNKKYASVNSSGVVTTKKAGAGKTVTVTAISDSSGEEATYKISIMKNPVKKIKLSASKKVLKKGKSLKIKAKFTPSSGISKELTWTSSNTKVAVVNNQGKVTAKGKGKVKITAKAKDGSGKKATITLKVK